MPQTTINLGKLQQDYYNYIGQIGEWLFKTDLAMNILFSFSKIEIKEGHEPFEFNEFTLQHLDFVLIKKRIIASLTFPKITHVIEIKTTHNQTKRTFTLNGLCGPSLAILHEFKVPISLGIIRLKPNYKPANNISQRHGFDAECTRIRKDNLYNLEVYNEKQLKITNTRIKVI